MKQLLAIQSLIRSRLWLKVLIGMVLGIVVGVLLGPTFAFVKPSVATILGDWLALPGQLFLTLIQMIVIPLVFASVIRGLAANENVEQLKKIGLRVVLFFTVTTAIATCLGLLLGHLIKPGLSISAQAVKSLMGNKNIVVDTVAPPDMMELPQKLITLLPGNPLNSMVEGQMLQVVIFAMLVGVALVTMKRESSKPMLDLLGSLQEICMTVVRWAMTLAPFAVFGLLAQIAMKIGLEILLGMALYMVTVLLGLGLLLVMFCMLVWIFTKTSPIYFLKNTKEVLLLAFSTSSSAAVMPLSIRTAEKLGVQAPIAQFVIPLGATINMNGTALYQGVATMFLAQAFGVDLSFASMALVVIMATGASIGSPGTPGVGLIILAMVLKTVGIPAQGIALIMGVDRILDMSRTAINVAGDLVACKVVSSDTKESEPSLKQEQPSYSA